MLNVLIVDDEATTRLILKNMLQKAGYKNVVAAADGPSALKLLSEGEEFHLIICDIHMPVMDGVQLLTELKQIDRAKDIPVVMMSATEDLDIIYRCLKLGADDYIFKPVRSELLKNLWANISRKRRENSIFRLLDSERSKSSNMNQHVREMQAEIAQLKEQVNEAIETPLQIISREIKDIIHANQVTPEVRDALSNIVKALSSSTLYKPAIGKLVPSAAERQGLEDISRLWLTSDLEYSGGPSPTTGRRVADSPELPPQSPLDTAIPSTFEASLRTWEFDLWGHNEDELLTAVYVMMQHLGLIDQFRIPQDKMTNFLHQVRRSYNKNNPYHNFRHCFDVVQVVFYFLTTGGASELLTPLEIFSLMVAALCHDLEHPGLNNSFQIVSNSPLALLYNDKSVLESHHCARAFHILRQPETNIIRNLTKAEYREFRSLVINEILATDMAGHMEIVGKLGACVAHFQKEDKAQKLLLLQMIIKCADISNPARPFPLAKYWAEIVQQEFYMQGQAEREAGLPISPFMDSENSQPLPKMQMSFIDFIVTPLYSHLAQVLPATQSCSNSLLLNRQQWQVLLTNLESSEEDEEIDSLPTKR